MFQWILILPARNLKILNASKSIFLPQAVFMLTVPIAKKNPRLQLLSRPVSELIELQHWSSEYG